MGGPNRHRSHAFAHKPTAGMTCPLEPAPLGTPKPDWVGCVGHGQNAGKRLQGRTKRLTFREGRLRLPTGTTRLESQAFRLLCVGPMVLALIFSLPFRLSEKEG